MSDRFVISETVARALAARAPVVALETTVVTHGLPHPEGLAAAAEIEREVVANGAVPATIGVLEGRIHIGMGAEDLERLISPRTRKLNLANLAAQVAAGEPGSTTVAATMFAAAHAGIRVFATGGIGGVHRGASESGDVSADLIALTRFPVAVVCAGAKAVLDLSKTVEMLETLGVPVYGVGTDDFPAFYRRSSGRSVDRRFDEIADLARAVRAHFELGLSGGLVVANPIPAEHEMPLETYEHAISAALADAEKNSVSGRDVTPFLLDRLRDFTASESLFSNRALLLNNAAVGARLAGEILA